MYVVFAYGPQMFPRVAVQEAPSCSSGEYSGRYPYVPFKHSREHFDLSDREGMGVWE